MQDSMMTVSSLNRKIKSLLEVTFMHTKVEGEIASVTYHQTSGHVYFSLKDDESTIRCVMFRSNAQKIKFRLEKGEHIVVEGSVGVYAPRGEYQFYAVHIEPFGKGALSLAYEQLKEKLKTKGYFEQKKAIPKLIQKVALVTAKDSAALHDMIKIIEKRWPLVSVTVIDTLVQGEYASKEISRALLYADTLKADVVIVGRGGGSTEDLWVFNEERVADAIYGMNTPTVSAVGHEIDTPISDFVADLRAPTPSAAIEMILPDKQELLYVLDDYFDRFKEQIKQTIFHKMQTVKQKNEALQQLSIHTRLAELMENFSTLNKRYKDTMGYRLKQYEIALSPSLDIFKQQISFSLEQKDRQIEAIAQNYLFNHPRERVKKGWAKVSLDGKIISLDIIEPDMRFTIEDADTKIDAICYKKINFSADINTK